MTTCPCCGGPVSRVIRVTGETVLDLLHMREEWTTDEETLTTEPILFVLVESVEYRPRGSHCERVAEYPTRTDGNRIVS
jgi:hypothetical protein